MPDLQKLSQQKERILSTIRVRGPSLPVGIAKSTGLSPLFASAFLSELFAEKRIKISNMKVGSSPLYFLEGQEAQLERFIEHLNGREKEALLKLKESKTLEDEKLAPVTRVALRAIKDFAIPVRVIDKGETKLFWRYFQAPENEVKQLLQEILHPEQFKPKETPRIEIAQPLSQQSINQPAQLIQEAPKSQELIPIQTPQTQLSQISQTTPLSIPSQPLIQPTAQIPVKEKSQAKEQPKETQLEIPKLPRKKAQKKPKKVPSFKFVEKIKEYLLAKDIEILEEITKKNKEFMAKIRLDTQFGKQEYFLVAKEKRKILEDDLIIAMQKAQQEKMPALFMAPGKPDKNAEAHLSLWRNLIKFEKIHF